MKRFFVVLVSLTLAALFAAAYAAPPQQAPANATTVIEGARVIDSVSNAAIENAVIVIQGDRIRAIGARASVQIPANARTVNMAGKTIMPGIVNVHGHIGRRNGMQYGPEHYSKQTVQRDANSYLYFGITHATSLGQDWPPMKEVIRDQRAGRAGGARLYTGEFGFSIEGGMQNANPSIHKPKTVEEARQMVQAMAANKPLDFIKLWVDGNPKMDLNVAGAAIEEADRQGLKSYVHLSQVEDARKLIEHGLDSMAHIPRDKELDDAFVRLAKEKGVTQTTNLIGLYGGRIYLQPTYLSHPGMRVMFSDVIGTINTPQWLGEQTARPPNQANLEAYDRAVRNLLKLHAAGVPIVIGSDSGSVGQFPGVWEHLDLELLVRAGLSPMEGIKAATINGARLLGVGDRYGSLEVGKVADFVVMNSNPLTDIKNTMDISAVWMNGQEVNRATLPVNTSSNN